MEQKKRKDVLVGAFLVLMGTWNLFWAATNIGGSYGDVALFALYIFMLVVSPILVVDGGFKIARYFRTKAT